MSSVTKIMQRFSFAESLHGANIAEGHRLYSKQGRGARDSPHCIFKLSNADLD